MISTLLNSGYTGSELFFLIIVSLFAIVLSFSVHEFAHSLAATKLGDNTSKNMGRLTLNPLSHLDPLGTVLLLLFGFGWGKPVVYNRNNLTKLKSRKASCIIVHLSGVTGNFLLSFLCTVIYTIISFFGDMDNLIVFAVVNVLLYTSEFCYMLLAFNLLPIPPLDGYHVLEELLPSSIKRKPGYASFIRLSPMILLALVFAGRFLSINILGLVLGAIQLPFRSIVLNVSALIYSLLSSIF